MNKRYSAGRDAQAKGEVRWISDDIEAVLVDTRQYKFNDRHSKAADITGIISSAKVPGRTVDAGGYCRAAEIKFPKARGEQAGAVVFYKNGGPLLAYVDGIEDFPLRLNGSDIFIASDFIYRI